jgi:hypothetical protein
MEWSGVMVDVVQGLIPVLMAALAWAGVKIATWINAKTKNEYLKGVLLRLNDAVLAAVRETEQTVVTQLKAAAADGKLTDDEKRDVKRAAFESVKAHFGSKGVAEVGQVLGLSEDALEKMIGARLEAAVHDMKLVQTAAGARAPA